MFINPVMLAGIGAAALPLVLHLLSRARCRTVEFSGMMFLDAGEGRQRQSPQLKQMLLLAMRMGMIVLLALALARPVVNASSWGKAGGGRTTAIVIVDASGSMAFDENGRSRMDLAREMVLQILSTLHRGDQAAIVVMGNGSGETEQVSSDLQGLALRTAELTAGDGEADIPAALNSAVHLLESTEGRQTPNHQIYVVCDQQARNWRSVNESFVRGWRTKLNSLGGSSRITVLPVGGMSMDNIGVESVELVNWPAIRGQVAELEVRVRNYGNARHDAVPVSCQINGRDAATASVNLGAGQMQPVRLRMQFEQAGSQTAEVQIKGAGLATDNRMLYAVDVIDPINVLVVSGREQSGAFRSESDYLHLALEPYQSGQPGVSNMARVKVVPSEAWNADDLGSYRAVVLANVPHLTPSQVSAIEQYVYGGGGLWIAPGNLVRAEDYNQSLYRDGSGVSPAMLSAPTPVDVGTTSLLGLDLNHPIFRFLKGRPDPVPSATIWRYFPAIASEGETRVLASYASGKPFLIERAFGHGRVLLMTTALNVEWASLPLSSFYLPFSQSIVRYLAAGESEERNLNIGEPIVMRVDGSVDEQSVQVKMPDGKIQREGLVIRKLGARSEVRYGATDIPGEYILSMKSGGGERLQHYVVRAPAGESDLTPLSRQEWEAYQRLVGFELVESAGEGIGAQLRAGPGSHELWSILLACVIGLAMAEMAATRAWSSGGTGAVSRMRRK